MALRKTYNFSGNIFVDEMQAIEFFEDYINECVNNPLLEEVIVGTKGAKTNLSKMRMPTIQGFAVFCGTSVITLEKYISLPGNWLEIFSYIRDAMHAISIEGAAAGLLKENLVSKKLGLVEKIEKKEERRIVIQATPVNGRIAEHKPIEIGSPQSGVE